MVAGNVARVIRAPGRVVIGPTDLSVAYPYGGTEVGKSNLCVVQPLGTSFRIEAEGLGEATDILEATHRYVFSCFLRGWDDDAVQKFFADNYSAGGTSKHAVFSVPGSAVPGASAIGRALIVLYVPDDTIHVPAVLVYSGVPDWSEGAEMAFQRGSELGLPVALDCLRDSNGNTLAIGRLADLSLT